MATLEISDTDQPCPSCTSTLKHVEVTQGSTGPGHPSQYYSCENPECLRMFDMHMDEVGHAS